MSSTTMTVTSASMISDDPPYKLVFVFVCLCVYVDMCLYVVEPSGFRVLGFFRCLRRLLSINETSPPLKRNLSLSMPLHNDATATMSMPMLALSSSHH